eukprot:TRINITY_DN848_c0_g1_i1.p1 TRINITY_DN848_c0_g1~~TRINITY_DN848_c0_g1_i1.p1  ORF type:complete len:2887 (+),score=549.09 TRINITY_DN848_c0_g1_i1:22-8661(+)
MKWADVLCQVTCPSRVTHSDAIASSLLPHLHELKEARIEDCKGLVGVAFSAALQRGDDPKMQRGLSTAITVFLTKFPAHAEDVTKIAGTLLSKETFGDLSQLQWHTRRQLLAYVTAILDSAFPKEETETTPITLASLPPLPETLPSVPALVFHQLRLVGSLGSTAHCTLEATQPVVQAWKHHPVLLGAALATVQQTKETPSWLVPTISLAYPLLRHSEEVSKLFVSILASAAGSTTPSGSRHWGPWVASSGLLSGFTATQFETTVLPQLVQGLKRAGVATLPAATAIFGALPSAAITLATAKDILPIAVPCIKEVAVTTQATVLCSLLCTRGDDALRQATLKALSVALGHGKDTAEKVTYLVSIRNVISDALTKQELRDAVPAALQADVLPALRTQLTGAPTEVRTLALEFLGQLTAHGIVADFTGPILKDLLKSEDEAVKRHAAVLLWKAQQVDPKKCEVALAIARQIVEAGESKIMQRPQCAILAATLLRAKAFALSPVGTITEPWLKKGIMSEGYLVGPDVLEKLEDNSLYGRTVLELILDLLPMRPFLKPDQFDARTNGRAVLTALLLLCCSRHNDVRTNAFRTVDELLELDRDLFLPQLWDIFRRSFLLTSSPVAAAAQEATTTAETAPAKAPPKPAGKAAPPPKGKKAPAKPAVVPQAVAAAIAAKAASAAAAAAPATASSSPSTPEIQPGLAFTHSRTAIQRCLTHLAAAVLSGTPPAERITEVVLATAHPAVVGDREFYWLQGEHAAVYVDVPPSDSFQQLFAPREPGVTKQTPAEARRQSQSLHHRALLKQHYGEVFAVVLPMIHSSNLESHRSAALAVSLVASVVGPEAIVRALHGEHGIAKLLVQSAVCGIPLKHVQLYNSGEGLKDIIDQEVEESAKYFAREDTQQKRENKGYSGKDEKWEAEVRKQQALEKGQDTLSLKKQARREELTKEYKEIIQEIGDSLRPVRCGLQALLQIAALKGNRAVVEAAIPSIIDVLLPMLAAELHDIILLSRTVFQKCVECTGLAPLHTRLSTAVVRLASGQFDPSRKEDDDDGLLIDHVMPKVRLACQSVATASNFAVLFPIIKTVLTHRQPVAKPKRRVIADPNAVQPIDVTKFMVVGKAAEDGTAPLPVPIPVRAVRPAAVAPDEERDLWVEPVFQQFTQQMCLSLLHNHSGLDLTNREAVVGVLVDVLEHVPSLYRSGVQALVTIAEHLQHSEIRPLLKGLQHPNPLVKEAALNALKQYSFFNQYDASVDEDNAVPPAPATNTDDVPEHEELKLLLWILAHDPEAPGVARSATLLRERANLAVPESYPLAVVPYLYHLEESIRRAAADAVAAAVRITPDQLPAVLEEMFRQYAANTQTDSTGLERTGAPFALASLADQFQELRPAVRFLCEVALVDANESVRAEALATGQKLMSHHGPEQHEVLLKTLQAYLDKKPATVTKEVLDYFTSAVVVLMGVVARFSTNPKQIGAVVDRLMSALEMPSESVQRSCCDTLATLVALPPVEPKIEQITQKCIVSLFQKNLRFAQKKGYAFGLAGITKGRRLSHIRQYTLMDHITKAGEAKSQGYREAALIAVEALSQVLGLLFEPYYPLCVTIILNCFSDKDANVRAAAEDASKAMMKSLSDHGVRNLLPLLLQGVDSTKWQTKVAAIELLGSTAYCSPKQLAACLPSVMGRLADSLGSAQRDVAVSALSALRRIGGVIKNAEIAQHVEVLLKALEQPAKETENALEALLFTRFVNSVDAPALALIYPILHRGLRERTSTAKMKAAQIIGSLSQLLADPFVMVPYVNELLPQLKTVLLDPIPEVRSTAAKAIGALVAGLGEFRFHSLVPWLLETMKCEASPVERMGAAQGFSEVIAAIGVTRLDQLLPDILVNCGHPKHFVREGYFHVFVFLPHALRTAFQPYIGKIFDRLLQGLADEAENVRGVALRAGQTIVGQYGQNCLALMLPALGKGLFAEAHRIRHSSLLLLGDLLLRVATQHFKTTKPKRVEKEESEDEDEEDHSEELEAALRKKREKEERRRLRNSKGAAQESESDDDEEDEEEEEEEAPDFISQPRQTDLLALKRLRSDKSSDSVVTALHEIIGDKIYDLLSAIQMLKSDSQVVVRNEATNVWKALVDNTPSMLRRILPVLTHHLVTSLAEGETERTIMAGRALGDLVGKLGSAVVPLLIPILERGLDARDAKTRHGVCLGFTELLSSATRSQLADHVPVVVPCITRAMCDADDAVRQTGGAAFDQLYKTMGPRCVEDILQRLIEMLDSEDPNEASLGANGLVQVVAVKGKVVLGHIVNVFVEENTLSEVHAMALSRIAQAAGPTLIHHVSALLPVLTSSLGVGATYHTQIEEAAIAVIQCLDQRSFYVLTTEITKCVQSSASAQRVGGAALAACLAQNIPKDVDVQEFLPILIQNVLRLYSDKDDRVRQMATQAMQTITDYIEKDPALTISRYLEPLHAAICISARTTSSLATGQPSILAAFIDPAGFKAVLPYYTKSISLTDNTREIAARSMGELIELAPPETLAKHHTMIGPIIRVINDKMPPSTKQAILHTLTLLIPRCGAALKAFVPQLQTTYAKAINDEATGTRTLGIRGLRQLLILFDLRVDSTVTELGNQLKTQKVPAIQASLLRAISLVFAQKAAKVSPAVVQNAITLVTAAFASDNVNLRSAAGKCLGMLAACSEALPAVFVRMTKEASAGQFTDVEGGLAGIAGILQCGGEKLSPEQVVQAVEAAAQNLRLDSAQCLAAARVLHKAFRFHGKVLPVALATKLLKAMHGIATTSGQYKSRVERKCLSCFAAAAESIPEAFGTNLGAIVQAVNEKAKAQGDPTYLKLVRHVQDSIKKNVSLGGLAEAVKAALSQGEPLSALEGDDSEVEEEDYLLTQEPSK